MVDNTGIGGESAGSDPDIIISKRHTPRARLRLFMVLKTPEAVPCLSCGARLMT